MKKSEVVVRRYDADEGLVFDWADPHYHTDENGKEVREHLNARIIYLGANDSISNYIEVAADEDTE